MMAITIAAYLTGNEAKAKRKHWRLGASDDL